MRAELLLVATLVGQPAVPTSHRWTPANVIVASSAAVSLLVDWAQTREALSRGWDEGNPVLGRHPTAVRLTAYNFVALQTVAGVGAALPTRWRTFWYAAVTLVESVSVSRNAALGLHLAL